MAHSGHENRVGKCPFWSAKQTSLAEGRPTLAHDSQVTAKIPSETRAFRACAVDVVWNQSFAADGLMFDQRVARWVNS
jgi:hypothetical protein